MTWIVSSKGRDYDVDPLDFTMEELTEVAERTGINGFFELVQAMAEQKPAAWKAAFWVVDRRADPELRWTGYAGPTSREVLAGLKDFDPNKLMGDLGGLVDAEGKGDRPSRTSGSARSPKSTATRRTSSAR